MRGLGQDVQPVRERSLLSARTVLLAAVLAVVLGGCSTQQIGRALGAFCHSAEPCTAYNSDGTPVSGRWYNPY